MLVSTLKLASADCDVLDGLALSLPTAHQLQALLGKGELSAVELLSVALAAGAWPVVVAAVVASIVAAFLYIRVIKVMYFDEPVGDGPSVAYPSVLTATTIAVGAAVTLVLGVLPGPVLDLAAVAGEFIR